MIASRYPRLVWGPRGDGSALTRVLVESASALAPEQARSIADVVDTFCRVGALGGFSDPVGPIAACTCRLVSHRRVGGRMGFELECTGIDHRAFQTLRNMLPALADLPIVKSLAVASDMLRWPPATVAPQIDEDNEERCYPPLHNTVRFDYGEDDEVVASWFRRCLVTLHHPVQQKHVDALANLVVPWFELLEFNGYAMPLDWPWDVANTADTVQQFAEDSIEITVMRFQSSEEAWSPLANMVWARGEAIGLAVHDIVVDP